MVTRHAMAEAELETEESTDEPVKMSVAEQKWYHLEKEIVENGKGIRDALATVGWTLQHVPVGFNRQARHYPSVQERLDKGLLPFREGSIQNRLYEKLMEGVRYTELVEEFNYEKVGSARMICKSIASKVNMFLGETITQKDGLKFKLEPLEAE